MTAWGRGLGRSPIGANVTGEGFLKRQHGRVRSQSRPRKPVESCAPRAVSRSGKPCVASQSHTLTFTPIGRSPARMRAGGPRTQARAHACAREGLQGRNPPRNNLRRSRMDNCRAVQPLAAPPSKTDVAQALDVTFTYVFTFVLGARAACPRRCEAGGTPALPGVLPQG